jgi:hypothetical protein
MKIKSLTEHETKHPIWVVVNDLMFAALDTLEKATGC